MGDLGGLVGGDVESVILFYTILITIVEGEPTDGVNVGCHISVIY